MDIEQIKSKLQEAGAVIAEIDPHKRYIMIVNANQMSRMTMNSLVMEPSLRGLIVLQCSGDPSTAAAVFEIVEGKSFRKFIEEEEKKENKENTNASV